MYSNKPPPSLWLDHNPKEPLSLLRMGHNLVPTRQLFRRIVIGIAAFCISLTVFLPFESATKPSTKSRKFSGEDPNGPCTGQINSVTNDTLGFSKIFVVGLPERSDKRDAFTLASALTGFHVEYVDGVKGETIPDKALPFGVNRGSLMESNLGSWRGHMNAIRRIVEEGLESALIMEDDIDWDVRLKAQLEKVAQGAQTIMPSDIPTSSPYGDGWDVIWLGHCGEIFPETLPENQGKPEHPKYTIRNDKTVPPRNKLTGLVDFAMYPEFTRWVHVAGGPICTFAYGLSQRGARKVLFDLSVDHLFGEFDNALAGFCRDGASGNPDGLRAKCISVTPPVFFHHKAKGPIIGDSDIQDVQGTGFREKGTTENMVWSAHNNIKNSMMGLEMENQFKD